MRSAGVQLHAAGFVTLATAINELSFTDLINIDQIVPDDIDIPEVVVQPQLPKAIEQLTRYVPSSKMLRPADQKQPKSAKSGGSKLRDVSPDLPPLSTAEAQEEDSNGSDSDTIAKPSGRSKGSRKPHKPKDPVDPGEELVNNLLNTPAPKNSKKRKRLARSPSEEIPDDEEPVPDETVIFVLSLSRVLANVFLQVAKKPKKSPKTDKEKPKPVAYETLPVSPIPEFS